MYYVFAAEAWDRPGQIVLEICFAESATALTAWIHQLENDYDGGLTTLTFLFMSDWSSLRWLVDFRFSLVRHTPSW